MDNPQYLDEIHKNHLAWQNKAGLRIVYRRFYQQIANLLVEGSGAPIVEIGSGIGKIIEVIPNCIRTDLVPNPWVDRVENAYQLSFDDESISNIILFDVFHHLKYPGIAMDEFCRVLKTGGRLIIFEPCISVLGLIVYGLLHQEPLGFHNPLYWQAESQEKALQQGYFAAQANSFRIFFTGRYKKLNGWNMFHRQRMASLAYLAVGGYSGPHFANGKMIRILDVAEKLLQMFPLFFAVRLLIGLEKTGPV